MKYLSIFQDVLDSIECPEHHKKPVFIRDNDNELQLSCCCYKFKRQCVYLVNKIAMLVSDE